MLRILLVCTGNTCRSPMAETLLREKIRQSGKQDSIKTLSAGIAAFGEYPASDGALEIMREKGLDLDKHRSCQLVPDLINTADIILTMTEGHKTNLLRMAPSAKAKTYTLAEFAGETGDVDDPVGQPIQVYRDCAQQMESLIDKA